MATMAPSQHLGTIPTLGTTCKEGPDRLVPSSNTTHGAGHTNKQPSNVSWPVVTAAINAILGSMDNI